MERIFWAIFAMVGFGLGLAVILNPYYLSQNQKIMDEKLNAINASFIKSIQARNQATNESFVKLNMLERSINTTIAKQDDTIIGLVELLNNRTPLFKNITDNQKNLSAEHDEILRILNNQT